VPLKYVVGCFGIVFTMHGLLLLLQVSCRPTDAMTKCVLYTSYLPALAEIVLLLLATVWINTSKRCNDSLLSNVQVFVYVLWGAVGLTVLFKMYRFCCSRPEPQQRWV